MNCLRLSRKFLAGCRQLSSAPTEVLLTADRNGMRTLTLNRPRQKNAFSVELAEAFSSAVRRAASDTSVKMVILTGSGDAFTAGFDMNNAKHWANKSDGEIGKECHRIAMAFKQIGDEIIDFSKPLIAAVNGMAVGIGLTILPLCDFSIASADATFFAPFSQVGLVPEMCSSVTFPALMGPSRANQIIVFSSKFGADEAKNLGLVNEIAPHLNFTDHVNSIIADRILPKFNERAFYVAKSLIRNEEIKKFLHEVNRKEMIEIEKSFQSIEFNKFAENFINKRK